MHTHLDQRTPILINAHPLNLGATTSTGQVYVHSYLWKHIKGNLTPDGIGEVQVCKLLLQYLEELCPEKVSHGSMWTREGSWDKECTAGQRVHHALAGHVLRHSPDAMLEVVHLEGVPLLLAAVASNGRYIQHAFTEFDEGATLYWQLDAWEERRRLGGLAAACAADRVTSVPDVKMCTTAHQFWPTGRSFPHLKDTAA